MFTASLVVYNQKPEALTGLVAAVLSSVDVFHVVDHSNDDLLGSWVMSLSPKVRYVHEPNRGFGAGHNRAIRAALADGADVHVIVNPDISFRAGTLETIAAHLRAHPEIGLLMPKTLNPDGSLQYNCKLVPTPLDLIGRRFLPKAWMRRRMRTFQMMDRDYSQTFEAPYLCGCFMAFRTEALREVGLFDERFFLYPEDIDLSRRMYVSRFKSVYWPGVEVIHAHAAASYRSWRMLGVHCVNMIRYFNKWGWFFDAERRAINRCLLARTSSI